MIKRSFFWLNAMQSIYDIGPGCNAALVVCFFGGIGLIVVVSSRASFETAAYVLLAMGSVIALLLLALFSGPFFKRIGEQRAIRRILTDPWVRWQYSVDEWREIVESEAVPQKSPYPLWTSIIAGLMIGAGIPLVTGSTDPKALPMMLPIGVLVGALIIGSTVIGTLRFKWVSEAIRRRRLSVPSPSLYIGADGLYHETEGYLSLKHLVKVGLSTGSIYTLMFTLRVPYGRYGSATVGIEVPIPRAVGLQSHEIIARFNVGL